MGIRLNNSFFRLDGASYRGGILATSPPIIGQIYRIANLGATNDNLTYTDLTGASVSTGTISSGSIKYVLAISGSLSDTTSTGSTGNLVITNLLITSSVNETPTFIEQIITTTGFGGWTKPVGITQVIAECWGGGGGGGGTDTNGTGGGGGGAGAYSRKLYNYPSSEQSIQLSVGTAGLGGDGTIGSGGGTGGDTFFDDNFLSNAGGGFGGENAIDTNTQATGGPGGGFVPEIGITFATKGDVTYFGAAGTRGYASNAITTDISYGQGGGAAGSTKVGDQPGNNDDPPIGGAASREFGGAGATGSTGFVNFNGQNGTIYGGGGSGGIKLSGGQIRLGGLGAQGLIRLIYNTPGPILRLDAENAASYPGTGTLWSDLSSNGYNATMTGSVTFVNTSPKYFNYTDTPNYFVGNSNLTGSISNAITIISWIKVTDITKRSVIFDKYQLSLPSGYVFEVGTATGLWTNTIRFFAVGSTGTGWDARGVSNAIQQNVTYMVAATLDSTLQQSSLYINSSSISFTEGGGPLGNLASNWAAGANNYTLGSYRPDETIDSSMQQYKLTVYNRALSSTEIANIYNAEKSLYGL
jgi:hypothetical protein